MAPLTDPVLVNDARAILADALGSAKAAERKIELAYASGMVTPTWKSVDGHFPGRNLADFFRRPRQTAAEAVDFDYSAADVDYAAARGSTISIDWEASVAKQVGPTFHGACWMNGVGMSRADLQRLMPRGYRVPSQAPAKHAGQPRAYDREAIVIAAIVYVMKHGLPKSANVLIEKVQLDLGRRAPEDTVMKEIIGPIYKGFKVSPPIKR